MARAAALVAVLALGACDGPNLFTGPGPQAATGARPPSVEILEPTGDSLAAVPVGDSLLVRARVRDDRGVDSVRFHGVALRGDPQLGTDVEVRRFATRTAVLPQARDTVVARWLLPTTDQTREVVRIVAEVFDVDGVMAADTALITVGGPRVQLLNLSSGQSVQAGLGLSLQMEATDPNGVSSVEFRLSGVFGDTLRRTFNPALERVRFDTIVQVPSGITGEVRVVALARNTLDVSGQAGPVAVRIVEPGTGDVTPPALSMTVVAPDRMEVGDSIRVQIVGADDLQGSGVARAGVTVQAVSPRRGTSETRVFTREYQPPRGGTISETIGFPPFGFGPLPDTVVFHVTAYLVDAQGNCGAAVVPGQTQSLPCSADASGTVTAASAAPFTLLRPLVAGWTVRLPAGGRIMDAAVDTVRRNLLLSNFTRDRIEVFRLQTGEFLTYAPVGSQPWGITLDRTGDTLIVANSGGTNISKVHLGPRSGTGAVGEVPSARLLMPRGSQIFEVERTRDDTGLVTYNVVAVPAGPSPPGPPFTDRPQFLVQDFSARTLFSTKTTEQGPAGSIRKAYTVPPCPTPEVLLFWEHAGVTASESHSSVMNVDSVTIEEGGVRIWDHVPGCPDQLIVTEPLGDSLGAEGRIVTGLERAVMHARADGSDASLARGRINGSHLLFTDTTFVAASGDRRMVVFGVGTAQFGRVIMFDAARDQVSQVIHVVDLLRNAAERVRGIGLNYDGTLGVARGNDAYFFTSDLRLQGVSSVASGGAGAALHPLHANALSLDNPGGTHDPNTHLAFVGTGERTVDIVDTFHFFRSGRVFLRDVVSGPLRAALPFPQDNAGLQCRRTPVADRWGNPIGEAIEVFDNGDFNRPHPPEGPTDDRCVVVKLFGVTDSGGVVIIDVRKADILRNHPARN